MGHEEQLAEALDKIRELEREKKRVEDAITAWKMIRDGYLKLDGKPAPTVDASFGPTEAMRVILSQFPDGLTSIQIRNQLKELGVKVGSGKYMMANVLTLLKKDKRIEVVQVPGGKVYRLKKEASQ